MKVNHPASARFCRTDSPRANPPRSWPYGRAGAIRHELQILGTAPSAPADIERNVMALDEVSGLVNLVPRTNENATW
jgi:hypothetical protein